MWKVRALLWECGCECECVCVWADVVWGTCYAAFWCARRARTLISNHPIPSWPSIVFTHPG